MSGASVTRLGEPGPHRLLTTLLSRSRLAFSVRALHSRGRPVLRVVNYHSIPESEREAFERQLDWFESNFTVVAPDALSRLTTGDAKTSLPRPALLLTFDDGLKSHAAVAAPALERRGLSGWFFIPTGLIGLTRNDVERINRAQLGRALEVENDSLMMNWADVERISQFHAVGSHTVNHLRLGQSRSEDRISFEVEASKEELSRRLGRPTDSFCWVGGELESYSAAAQMAIVRAGYRYSFMTNSALVTARTHPLWIERSNVEALHPLERVDVVLSGLNDIRYFRKRLRVRSRITGERQAGGIH